MADVGQEDSDKKDDFIPGLGDTSHQQFKQLPLLEEFHTDDSQDIKRCGTGWCAPSP